MSGNSHVILNEYGMVELFDDSDKKGSPALRAIKFAVIGTVAAAIALAGNTVLTMNDQVETHTLRTTINLPAYDIQAATLSADDLIALSDSEYRMGQLEFRPSN